MNVLSLFDGISCARVALERAGIPVTTYWASEIDKYAIQISRKNYPDIFHIGDVTTVQGLMPVDILIGGSPCQDLSIAKRGRKGLDGERSGLFWEYVRILHETKPKYFILENVASMPKEAKQVITDALGVEPIMIDAALVSAQRRKRLFWTNIPNVQQPEDRGILLQDILEHGEADRLKSYCIDANYHKGSNWEQYKKKGRRQLIVSPVALRNRGQGKKPEYNKTGKANSLTTVYTDSMVKENLVIRKLSPIECERLQGLPDNYTDGVSHSQRYKMLGNAFNVDVVAHILSFIQ